jgi:hypothetical protein
MLLVILLKAGGIVLIHVLDKIVSDECKVGLSTGLQAAYLGLRSELWLLGWHIENGYSYMDTATP